MNYQNYLLKKISLQNIKLFKNNQHEEYEEVSSTNIIFHNKMKFNLKINQSIMHVIINTNSNNCKVLNGYYAKVFLNLIKIFYNKHFRI